MKTTTKSKSANEKFKHKNVVTALYIGKENYQ